MTMRSYRAKKGACGGERRYQLRIQRSTEWVWLWQGHFQSFSLKIGLRFRNVYYNTEKKKPKIICYSSSLIWGGVWQQARRTQVVSYLNLYWTMSGPPGFLSYPLYDYMLLQIRTHISRQYHCTMKAVRFLKKDFPPFFTLVTYCLA